MLRRSFHLCLAIVCLGMLAMALSTGQPATLAAPDTATGRPDSATFTVGTRPGEATLNAIADGYLSPIHEAPRLFTHMLLRWNATLPVSATVELEVRASLDGQNWTDWGAASQNPDLWVPNDGDEVFWSQEIYAGEGAKFYQVRASLGAAPDGSLPTLYNIAVHTVDARWGDERPGTEDESQNEATESSSSVLRPSSISKPAIVSRTGWGSPDGQGSRVRPVYYPVNHMTVHHTADANSLSGNQQNWADRVRAIWSFHTYTREWGDIGYNYLIDPNGVIYEGRAGGDDAVAFHDTANYGSMGVSMIGTYSTVGITGPASNSLVNVLAWKAAQKGIDPLGRSFYYGCSISKYCKPYNAGSIVENIAGHRQVTPGRTTCPGDALLATLPTIRNRVAERLRGDTTIPDNGDLQIDELETSFSRSNQNWYTGACGYGGNNFYTYTTDRSSESTNWGVWKPNFPADGSYRVFAAIPKNCNLASVTTKAKYRITHAGGTSEVIIDQSSASEWVDLGLYDFRAGQAGSVRLDDLTGEPYSQRKIIFFDSMRFVPERRAQVKLDLLDVAFERTTLPAGELLGVRFTVRNSDDVTVASQEPQAGRKPDGSFNVANSYVYDEGECFLGATGQDYPAFAKEAGRFRLALGMAGSARPLVCNGNYEGYPWRWGLNGPLAPGETRVIQGYIRFRQPGTVTLQAALFEELVRSHADTIVPTTITITPEKLAPEPAAYDDELRPLAQVYRLGDIPDNLLARTNYPLSVVKGAYLGSFIWDGATQNWGEGGPVVSNARNTDALSQTNVFSDAFVVEQTRVFIAPIDGEYSFQVTSDDGAWLWVDGREVISNYGIHNVSTVTATLNLSKGRHVLAFKYFERTGDATAGYALRAPGACAYGPPIDGVAGAAPTGVDTRLGATFQSMNGLTIAAADQGGSGVVKLRYTWNGEQWIEEEGSVLTVGRFVRGSYTLRYQAIDAVGNSSPITELRFNVDPDLFPYRTFFPLVPNTGGGCAS
jgi:hypothetical protein